MAITDKLAAVADAIRGKTGKAEKMTLDQMPGEIEGIQTGGGGDIVGDNSVPNSVAGMLYAITSGTAKSGNFTLAAPLPGGESLAFSIGLENPNGILIFSDAFLNVHTVGGDYTDFVMWLANTRTTEEGEPIGRTFSLSCTSSQGRRENAQAPIFTRSSSSRLENGDIYVTPNYGSNKAYTPFGPGVTYYWFAW